MFKSIDRSRTNVEGIKKGQHSAKYKGCKEVKEILCFVDRASRYNHVKKKQLLDFKLSPCSECCMLSSSSSQDGTDRVF
jgi:hypothetical protein